jgi:cytochrome c1
MEKKMTCYDQEIQLIFEYLKQLLNPPQAPRPAIGFKRSHADLKSNTQE